MIGLRVSGAVVGAALLAACASVAPGAQQARFGEDGMPLGRLSGDVVPHAYALDLRIDPSQRTFSGVTDIDVVLASATDHIWMHGNGLRVADAYLALPDGRRIPASYEQRNDTGSALLTLTESAPAGPAELHLAYRAAFDTSADGLFRQKRDGRWYAATQLEPISARKMFPGFDEPGFKIPFTVTVSAPGEDSVVANAPETSADALGDGWVRHAFAPTAPLPSYLVALAVGPYDVVDWAPIPPDGVRAGPLPLRGVAVSGFGERLDFALENTGPLLSALEGYFAVPYPFAKLDVIAMPASFGGAMENAALIAYDEYLLLMTADSPLAQRRTYFYVHAHEMAHMWFGDLVTPSWWDDIWLNESFANWMMYKIAEEVWPEGAFDRDLERDALGAMGADSLVAARRIHEPVLRDAETSDIFDSITYEKGAGVLGMLEAYLGEDVFRDSVRLYISRYAHGTATADDFMDAIAEGSGDPDIAAAFRSFIEQPGVPLLQADVECPANGPPRVRLRQSRYRPLGSQIDANYGLWRIPACIAYAAGDAGGRTCGLVTRREQTIALDAPSCPSSILPNADGAGYYRFSLDAAGWAGLVGSAVELSARDALATADSLDAAFRAGTTSADSYVAGLAALAGHPAWDVVDAVAGRLESATSVLDDDALEAARPRLAALFRDRYAALGNAPDGGERLLRTNLARFLALVAKDPDVRGEMTAQAAQRIGVVGAADFSNIDPDLRATVLSVGVQELDDRFFDLLLGEALSSRDPGFRNAALGALARTEDPAQAAKLRNTLLADRLRGEEALGVIARQLARRATRDAAWAWVKTHGDDAVALAPATFRSQEIPGLGGSFCTPERAQELADFIEAHAAALPGYERSLAQTEERIALCVALKDAQSADLAAALEKLPE